MLSLSKGAPGVKTDSDSKKKKIMKNDKGQYPKVNSPLLDTCAHTGASTCTYAHRSHIQKTHTKKNNTAKRALSPSCMCFCLMPWEISYLSRFGTLPKEVSLTFYCGISLYLILYKDLFPLWLDMTSTCSLFPPRSIYPWSL